MECGEPVSFCKGFKLSYNLVDWFLEQNIKFNKEERNRSEFVSQGLLQMLIKRSKKSENKLVINRIIFLIRGLFNNLLKRRIGLQDTLFIFTKPYFIYFTT